MAHIKEKVGVLLVARAGSPAKQEVAELGAMPSVSFQRPPRPISATARSEASSSASRPRSATGSMPVTTEQAQHLSSRKDKHQQALKLWREWAEDALGPMSSEPRPEDLDTKSKRIKHLERKCAELAALAQRRLEASAKLRGNSSVSMHGTGKARPASAGTFQGIMWSARETRKSKTYDLAREMGKSERSQSATPSPSAGLRPASASAAQRGPSASYASASATASPGLTHAPASHSLLEAILSGSPVGAAAAATAASPGFSMTGAASERRRPQSTLVPRTSSYASPSAHSPGMVGGGGEASRGLGAGASRQQKAAQLQAEAEALRHRLDEARAQVEAQGEVEAQLRDTIDLLRARLHGQSQREVENQRRLQQHTRLEPLFDQLAERFTFKTPQEVVARLEMLEDDKLGTFDQLLMAQEEVVALQSQLREAHRRVETARTQATTDSIRSASRLQQQNEELRAELEAVESLNTRLVQRQELLVQLQTAVLDLWGRCQDDPAFAAANGDDGGGGGGGGGVAPGAGGVRHSRSVSPGAGGNESGKHGSAPGSPSCSPFRSPSRRPGTAASTASAATAGGGVASGSAEAAQNLDPLSVMALIKEYVISRSPKLSSRHYLDTQRIANRVWSSHFRHKANIRGKVVETFEQLSTQADVLASKAKTATEQLQRTKQSERFLAESLRRVEAQRRSLEIELDRRNQLVRDLSGIPRKQRPQSAVDRTREVLGPEAMLQLRTSTTAAPTAGTTGASAHAGGHGQSSYLSHLGSASSASLAASAAGGGPQSAPVKRPASAAPSAYQSSAVDAAAGGTVRYKQPEAQVGATPRRPHSAVQRTGQRERAVHIMQRPTGDHWSLYSTAPQAQVQSVQETPTLGGALVAAVGFGTDTGTAAGARGAAAGSGAWAPPKKSAIEASFLSRLQRSATCRG